MKNTDYAKPLQADGKTATYFDFNQFAADIGSSAEKTALFY